MNLEMKDYIDGDRLLHTLKVAEKVANLSEIYFLSEKEKKEVVKAAIFHDIGYSEKIIKTGFHPLDGYL